MENSRERVLRWIQAIALFLLEVKMNDVGAILVTTDFSTESDQAFRVACSIARDQGARLVVLHVIPPSTVADDDAGRPAHEDWPSVRHCASSSTACSLWRPKRPSYFVSSWDTPSE